MTPSDSPVSDSTSRVASVSAAIDGHRPGSGETRFGWVFQVYAAFALAVAAPLYSRLAGRMPFLEMLEPLTVFIVVLAWSVVIPGTMVLAFAVVRRWNARAGSIAVMSLIGCSCSLILLGGFGHRLSGGGLGWLTLAASIATGYYVARGYWRWQWLRSFLNAAAVGSLLFPMSLLSSYFRIAARPELKVEVAAQNPVPVVMVVFDCFCGIHLMDQNRQIDVNRYPRFAELAATSNWYRNCTSVHPRTNRAVPAILTGALSPADRDVTVADHPQNLFTLLKATGKYQLTAFEPVTRLCPPDRRRDRAVPNPWTQWIMVSHVAGAVLLHDLVPADLNIDTPTVPRIWFGLEHVVAVDPQQRQGLIRYSWDIGRNEQFRHFLDCIQASEQPNLWFGHFALPHFPWNYLPSGHLYARDTGLKQVWGTEGVLSERWADDEDVVLQAHQQHLLQLGYTDMMLGEMIDRLRATGQFDRSLLIVMADHGVAFRRAMSGREPTDKNLAEIMSVPLFIKLPGQSTGDVVDLNVEITDVLPTLLDILKLTPPTPIAGRSVVAADFAERPAKVFNDDNREFVIDATFETRHDVLIEQLSRFGTGADPLRIFKIGPHSELLGRPLDKLVLASPSPIQIRPLNFAAVVESGSGLIVPAHLEAKIEVASPATRPIRFAIAVNDTVWGTTQTYRVSYLQDYWRVMLPETAIRNGDNRIRIFQIEESPQGPTLAECPIGKSAIEPRLP